MLRSFLTALLATYLIPFTAVTDEIVVIHAKWSPTVMKMAKIHNYILPSSSNPVQQTKLMKSLTLEKKKLSWNIKAIRIIRL